MNSIHQSIRELVWQTIAKHYSVDRKEPRVLLYKEIFMSSNPIDNLADTISNAFEQIVAELSSSQASPSTTEPVEQEQEAVTITPVIDTETMHDDYSEGDYNWNSYGYEDPFT